MVQAGLDKISLVLTTHSIACTVDSCDLWIQLNHHIPFLSYLQVTCLNSTMHPRLEGLAYERVDDVSDVLPR